MAKIAIKTIEGAVYSGEIVGRNENTLKLKSLRYHNVSLNAQVPNLAHSEGNFYFPEEVVFFWDKIIWFSDQS